MCRLPVLKCFCIIWRRNHCQIQAEAKFIPLGKKVLLVNAKAYTFVFHNKLVWSLPIQKCDLVTSFISISPHQLLYDINSEYFKYMSDNLSRTRLYKMENLFYINGWKIIEIK